MSQVSGELIFYCGIKQKRNQNVKGECTSSKDILSNVVSEEDWWLVKMIDSDTFLIQPSHVSDAGQDNAIKIHEKHLNKQQLSSKESFLILYKRFAWSITRQKHYHSWQKTQSDMLTASPEGIFGISLCFSLFKIKQAHCGLSISQTKRRQICIIWHSLWPVALATRESGE